MDINITLLIATILCAIGAWYVNDKLNPVPFLKQVVFVLIVVIALLCIWGALGIHNHYLHIG